MNMLSRDFYNDDSTTVAKELLGKYLVHIVDGEELVCKIVETEAYMGEFDKAAHSYNNKRTNRTEVMFGSCGFAYVFSIYGMYFCMNIITREINIPQAVLIRAAEPVKGFEKMAYNRYKKQFKECSKNEIKNLTNGPGKLCKAMDISKANNGFDLCGDCFYIAEDLTKEAFKIVTTKRINIDYAEEAIDYPYRFYIKDNKYVSKKA